MRRVEYAFRPQAQEDVIEIARYIAEDNPQVADEFFNALEQACETLSNMPEIGSVRKFNNPLLEGLRLWPIKGFEKYLVFYLYRTSGEGIDVIRVLHGARDLPAIFEK